MGRGWLISLGQIKWQNEAQMIKSWGRAGDVEGSKGKFVFSVMHTWRRAGQKTLLFHTPKLHIVPPPLVSLPCYQTQITGIICQISCGGVWMCVWQSVVTYHRGKRQRGLGKNTISHASHIPEINFYFFFPPSQSVITDWFVFSVISFGGEQSCPGRIKNTMAVAADSLSFPSKSTGKVDDTKRILSGFLSRPFLPRHLNLLFCANEWLPMYYRSLKRFHLLSLRCTVFSLWKQ